MCRTVPSLSAEARRIQYPDLVYPDDSYGRWESPFKLYASLISGIRLVLAAVRVLQSKHTLVQAAVVIHIPFGS